MAVRFDNSIIYQVQQANDIVEVISEHLRLDKKGREFVGLCPFHEDHKPSMYVSPVKNIFKCFACGAGGDVIKFVQMRENLTFPEAVERLADRAGIKLQKMERPRRQNADSPNDYEPDPKELAKVNIWAARFFRDNLLNEKIGEKAREYVAGRDIDEKSVKTWGVGFAVDGWDTLLKQATAAGFSKKLLEAAGLIVSRDNSESWYDKFRNRLMFPIIDATNRVIGFGGRTLGDDPAKYMNSPATVLFDKSNCVYGLNQARYEIVKTTTAVIVEGYTDVMMAHQFSVKNVVATLGTSFTAGHARLLRRFAKNIVLIFDSDIAGSEAGNRALEVCLAQKVDIKIASLPIGKDPCDFLLSDGTDAFRDVIDNAVEVMEYKWDRLKTGFEKSDNLVDRKNAVRDFIETVSAGLKGGNIDPLGADLIVGRLSRLTGISTGQLKDALKRKSTSAGSGQGFAVENQRAVSRNFGEGFFARAQQEIIEVLLCEPSLYEQVRGKVAAESFDVPIFREIAEALFAVLESGSSDVLVRTLGNIESADASKVVMDIEEQGRNKGNFKVQLAHLLEIFDSAKKTKGEDILETIDDDADAETLRRLQELAKTPSMRKSGMT